jgi:3',5'-cyclic AMP phosphodiesterase CpdA
MTPQRGDLLTLLKRSPRNFLDTVGGQVRELGFWSLTKPASYNRNIVNGVAQHCFEKRHNIDGILITGDLATTGMQEDIAVAGPFIEGPVADGFVTASDVPTLGSTKVQIYLLPGNHDKYADESASPNGVNFEAAFKGYMRNFRGSVGHWVQRKQNHYIGFIYADFCLRRRTDAITPLTGHYGQGRVYQEVLDELKQRSSELRGRYQGIYLVWLIHFAPFDCGEALELIGRRLILEASNPLGVIATICGHTHTASKHVTEGHIVYCGGSAGCIDREHDSRVHTIHFDIDKEVRISRESFQWSVNQHEFVPFGND